MKDVIIIGGGPAGLAAAVGAYKKGAKKILVIERDIKLGGILNQCIHNGFGIHKFKEELTGSEYAKKYIDLIKKYKIEVKLDTMVLKITPEKEVCYINTTEGYSVLKTKTIILAMGCRERTRGAISIPGDRPAGILTAGTAQRFVNIDGYMVGRNVLVLGSGDIGLIMARRMTLEGAKVIGCVELMPYSNGLSRNIAQCLDDYDIPLYLSHTITNIKGKARLEEVTIAKVDENRRPIQGTEKIIECDTLLLSVGLIPENELTEDASIQIDPRTKGSIVHENMETSIDGIYACGNVVHVHDLVDYVSEESEIAGKSAAEHCKNTGDSIDVSCEVGITYALPQKLRINNLNEKQKIFFRVNNVYKQKRVTLYGDNHKLHSWKKNHMSPGEMENVIIKKEWLADVNKLTLCIE